VSDVGVSIGAPWRGSLVTAARTLVVVNELIIAFTVGAFVRAALAFGPAAILFHVHGLRNSSSYGCVAAGESGTSELICRYGDPFARVSSTYAFRIPSLGTWTVARPVFFLVMLVALTLVSLVFGGWKAVRLALGQGTETSRGWTWSWLGLYGAFGAFCALSAAILAR
jgi:hypothetical protein